jgi:uncharacterized coiled-coil DUF342 family protein
LSEKIDEKFWETDEYLKQNATGTHSKSITILEEVTELKKEISDLPEKIEKFGHTIFFGIISLTLMRFF